MKIFKLFLIGLLWCAIALVLPGCKTQKGFNRTADKNPVWLAELCHKEFPVKETLIQGKSDTLTVIESRTDTVTTTIINTVTGKPVTVKIPCPPCKSTTNTIFKTDTIIKVDKAEVFLAQEQNEELLAANKTKNKWLWILAGISLLSVGVIVLRFVLR